MEAASGLPPPLPPLQAPIELAQPPAEPSFLNGMDPHTVVAPPAAPPTLEAVPRLDEQPSSTSDDQPRHSGSEDGSGSEHDDSEDEEDTPHNRWHPIEEDISVPCSDELAYIETKDEHSAEDHTYWEKQIFFELHDPELVPVESGRIDWLIEAFNGTKDQPNNELIMHSPVVHIAGLDWRIKFYPRGQDADFLSCYIECVSMQSPDFQEFEDFSDLPFPLLKNSDVVRKRRSAAVQLGVVMYNPAEPRVNEYKTEATQFSKATTDYGWRYFSQQSRYDFHIRQHTQRQAILRGDKLAFSAYIRVIHDPTGCKWRQGSKSDPNEIVAATGLRPFTKSLQYISGAVPLLHFAPFRKFVQNLPPDSQLAKWLQSLLLKMYTRRRSPSYGTHGVCLDGDVVELMSRVACCVRHEHADDSQAAHFHELVGTFHSEKGSAIGSNRLNTKEYPSIQAAVAHHAKLIACPALLTLELQRQEHDKKDRKWKKITNRVKVEEHITVHGSQYTLYAFITHCGHLQSFRYNSYVRPKGIGKGWYAYQDGRVTRLTEKEARERHSGSDPEQSRPKSPEEGYDSPFSEHHDATAEVTSVVMYVRDDVAASTFQAPDEDVWIPASCTQTRFEEAPKTALHESFAEHTGEVYGQHGTHPVSEEEFARLQAIRELIEQAAAANTPEPEMDGEDVVMKDADDDSAFSVDEAETEPAFRNDNLDKGTFDWLGQAYYEGEWARKKYEGGGHLVAINGDEYIGQFSNGLKHGTGKMTYAATGDEYQGEWVEDFPHGKGTLIERSTGNIYKGNFKEGRKHGDFVLTGTVTEEDKGCCSICYEKEMSTAFYDCGHVVACRDCAAQIDTCPVCRRRVVARLQLYGVRISQC